MPDQISPAEETIKYWIRDFVRRNNSGVGNRKKSAQTAQSSRDYILAQIAEGDWATRHITDMARLDGYPNVTASDVQNVARMMQTPQVPA